MGALFGDQCHVSDSAAADAFYLAGAPSLTTGATTYVAWFEKVSGVWQLKRQTVASDGTVTSLASSVVTVPDFPDCDPTESFTDGLAVGWGIAALMVAAWGYSKVRQAAR